MSEKVIILYDSQYKRALEAALDKKIEDVKWYSVDSMTTQLYEIAVTIMQDGCVTSNARVFVLVGTYKRRKVHMEYVVDNWILGRATCQCVSILLGNAISNEI